MHQRARDLALRLAASAGVAAFLALHDSRVFVLAGPGGWRGVLDPPRPGGIAAALAGGALVFLARRWPVEVVTPLVALLVALLPLVPLATGAALPLLAFQGALLTLLAVAACGASLFRLARCQGLRPGDPSGAWLFGAAFVFYAALAARVPGPAGPQGDEPHYLAMAQSVVSDRDLDLTDEFAHGEYHAFFAARLAPHASPNTPPGRLYSLHAPGLPLVLAPAYALGGFRGAQLAVAAIVALAGVLVHRLVRDALGAAEAAAAWAAFALGPPAAVFAVSLYPESVAVLPVAGLLLAARARPRIGTAVAAGLLAGALPWLHAKMAGPALAGLALVLVRPHRWRHRLAGLVAFAGPVGLLLVLFARWYGRPSLSAAFGPPDLSAWRVPAGLGGLFLDRQFGLWIVAPAWALAAVGLVAAWRRRTGDLLRGLLVASPLVLVSAAFPVWWGGSSPPARFLVPVLPALAVALGAAAAARPALFAALTAWGIGVIGLAADAPRILHNRPDGEGLLLRHLSRGADLNAMLPSFVPGGGEDRPLVDPRVAALDVLDGYDPARAWSIRGPLAPVRLRVPLDLPRRPWSVEAGEIRHSRRVGVPPGSYRLVAVAAVEPGGAIGIEAHSGEIVLGRTRVDAASSSAVLPLVLPVGARFLGVSAVGIDGRGTVHEVALVPVHVVPAGAREGLRWPEMALPDRYRASADGIAVTVVDRTAVEGDTYLVQRRCALVVDGRPGARVRVEADQPVTLVAGGRAHAIDGGGSATAVVTGADLGGGVTAMPLTVTTAARARIRLHGASP